MSIAEEQPPRQHVLRELGFTMSRVGEQLHGEAEVFPEMFAPGTHHLRTSVLATWADTLAGLLIAEVIVPRVPVTIELDVHLYRPGPTSGTVRGAGRMIRRGRSVSVATVEFVSGAGEPIGISTSSFMSAPDPNLRLPSHDIIGGLPPSSRLAVPLAERAGCERRDPGVVVLPRTDDGLNSSNTVNGGLLALATEEAALSLSEGKTLSSLTVRFLQPVRIGPAVATARVRHGLGHVEVRDAGSDDRLSAVATTRTFP